MTDSESNLSQRLIDRIVIGQIILLLITSVLVAIAAYADFGFFWFAFIAGIFGASVALVRRAQRGDENFAKVTLRSWITTMAPFLYGGLMAGITYFLFMSRILSGTDGDGLLATNLFPDFYPTESNLGAATIQEFLQMRPAGLANTGKLMVWCFLAGYSESFVSGILKRLEQNTGEN